MSDETRMTESEAATEEQSADETQTEEESAPQAEAETATEEQPADDGTPTAEESAPQAVAEAAAEEQPADDGTPTAEESALQAVAEATAEEQSADDGTPAAEERAPPSPPLQAAPAPPVEERASFHRVEGPANFNRAKQGNQRRNPRHVGNDVRIDEIDYKNVQVLSRFVDNYGRIHNRRKTRVTAKMQRKVTRAIKRARHLALMPYTGEHIRITGRRG